MTPRRFHRLREVLARRQPDLTVLLENVHKPHNLGAILRSCDAVGVFEAHAWVAERNRVAVARKAASGTGSWVELRRHETIARAVGALKDQGFSILAANLSERSRDFRDVDYTRPTAILLGQELDGVSPEAASLADAEVVIPMAGMVDSLNVSVAAALLLFEAQKQRQEAGLYAPERPNRLPSDLFETTLFEWTHPRIAARCRDRGAPYPKMDEDGEILGGFPR